MADNLQIKDLLNPTVVSELADRIKKAWPKFDHPNFIKHINPNLSELTYSQRSELITDALDKYLPDDFPTAVGILLRAQLPPYESDELNDTLGRFITVPQCNYISRNGLDHFDISMNALYEMTQRLTAEWGIRIFLIKYPEKTIDLLTKWATDENAHVRRLVSEGSRPFLPWGKRLNHFKDNPKTTLELLEILKNDPSEYVRRSVANHLNDHAKNHPDLIINILNKWKKEHPHKNMERLIKHAIRTLVKDGHTGALELIGFQKGAKIKIENLQLNTPIKIGEYLEFSFDLISTSNIKQDLIIDYLIYFNKANGDLSPKVFKMTAKEIAPKEIISLNKRHSFKIITTRKYYPGLHKLSIQINGEEKAEKEFDLTTQ